VFLDEAEIEVKGGTGGNGAISFRREKYVPRGGPNGGTGGNGGSVIFIADEGSNTLVAFRYQKRFEGGRGEHGGGSNRQGARGDDVRIQVPVGTIVTDAETGEILADLVQDGQEANVARGGRGGRGNAAFKSPTNQAPRMSEKGTPGEERRLKLELKLIADVGLIGLPNAGKSTLLASLTAARPKIADYPFTTLQPNLGVAQLHDRDIVFADIPGLIEGASEGAGLGDRFLRHIERTRLLVHMLDGGDADLVASHRVVADELTAFSPELGARPSIVVINTIDQPEVAARVPALKRKLKAAGIDDVLAISAAAGQHVDDLLQVVAAALRDLPASTAAEAALPVLRPVDQDDNAFTVFRVVGEDAFRVRGPRVERAAAMTDFENPEAADRFQRILDAIGVNQRLRELGIENGDAVRIGIYELEWME
jgi:GTP-binding protein